jgi:hypothetical protein
MDERSPGTIQKLVKGFEGEDNGLDYIWEQMTVEPGKNLETLFDPYEVDAKWLPWLKSLVGFTRDLSFNATETEVRRLIANAVKFWNEKPTELSLETAIRVATANRFRVRNYFDFRFQSDQTGITEELEDFDPTVIDFGEDVYHGSLCTQLDVETFSIADLPGDLGVYGFTSTDQFLYIQILDGVNKGTYALRDLAPGGSTGRILGTFPAGASATPAQWRLTGGMAEYVTEIRVVGEGEATMGISGFTTTPAPGATIDGATSGAKAIVHSVDTDALGLLNSAELTLRKITGRFLKGEQVVLDGALPTEQTATVVGEMVGVLNTGLLEFLIEQMRPASERLDLVIVDFIDEFSEANDYSQWTADHFSAGTPQVTVAAGTGYAEVGAQTFIVSGSDAGDYMNDWYDQTTMWKVQAGTSGTVLQGFFFVQNMTLQDAFYWALDYNSQELKLFKRVGGVDTQIGSTVVLPFLFANQEDTVRIDAVAEGADTRIRVKVDGDVFIDEADPQWEKGRIAFATSAGTGRLLAAEVNTVPTIIRRIGPR